MMAHSSRKTASPEDGEQCYHHKAQVPSCVQWLIKRFPFFFFYCIYSCHGYVYVYVWSDTSNLLLFFVSLLWRTTWSLLQDCCWGWIPPQDQDTCVLWVWQKNRINEKKEAQCSPYALIVYAIMCCSRWKWKRRICGLALTGDCSRSSAPLVLKFLLGSIELSHTFSALLRWDLSKMSGYQSPVQELVY